MSCISILPSSNYVCLQINPGSPQSYCCLKGQNLKVTHPLYWLNVTREHSISQQIKITNFKKMYHNNIEPIMWHQAEKLYSRL